MVRVPKITTYNSNKPHSEKYTIDFAPELIPFILKGQKVTTYRFGNKYDYLNVGDLVRLKNSTNNEIVGKAKIISKSKSTFDKLPLDTNGHESYKDKEQQRTVLSGYYAFLEREIKDSDQFIVLSFKLIQ